MAIVEAKDLVKTYDTGAAKVTALAGVNLRIDEGSFTAVMGPSGCGKSTLLHMLGGLDSPTSGSVLIDGQDISQMSDDELTRTRRQKIGFVFQSFNLVPVMSTIENVALPLTLDGMAKAEAYAKARQWLKVLGLEDRLSHSPAQLSGGQQQRVAIARALVAEPALILADEPTGNLDSKSADDIAGQLKHISADLGRTVLMVTHDPRIAAYADALIFLKDGAIVSEQKLSASSDVEGQLAALS